MRCSITKRLLYEHVKKFVPDGVACAVIVAIALLLYRKVVRLWWMYDDAIHLQILRHATLPQLLTRERGPLFTPLQMVSLLMTRHYIEGAIWALVATILFVAARQRDSLPLAIASATVYLAAAVSK